MGKLYSLESGQAVSPGFYDDHNWDIPLGPPSKSALYTGSIALLPSRPALPPERLPHPTVEDLQQQIDAGRLPSSIFLS